MKITLTLALVPMFLLSRGWAQTRPDAVRQASHFAGPDWCAKVAAADADLGTTPGEIWVDQNASPGACARMPALAPQHTLRFLQGGTYVLSGTLTLPLGARLISEVGGQPMQSRRFGTAAVGSVLKYEGNSAGAAVLRVAGNDVAVEGVAVDCRNNPGGIGILYSSGPESYSGLNVRRVATYNCTQGFVIGDPSNEVADCQAAPNSAGCHQADFFTVDYLTCYGNSGHPADECVHLNAANGGQQSVLNHVYGSGMNIDFHLVRTNGELIIENSLGGSPQGKNPVMIRMEPAVSQPITLLNNECEGKVYAYAVHDSSYPHATTPSATWIDNGFFCPVLIDGNANIVSLANAGLTGSFTVAGQALVQSINDQRLWKTAGNGRLDARYIGNDLVSGTVTAKAYATVANCSSSSYPANCGAAAAGAVVLPAGSLSTIVNTSAVTANSQILLQEDATVGARLGVTCNTTPGRIYTVTARKPGASFSVSASAPPDSHPACLSFAVIN